MRLHRRVMWQWNGNFAGFLEIFINNSKNYPMKWNLQFSGKWQNWQISQLFWYWFNLRSKSLFWKLPWSMAVNLPPIFFQWPQSSIEARGQSVTQKTWFSNFLTFFAWYYDIGTKSKSICDRPHLDPSYGVQRGPNLIERTKLYFFWLIALRS